MSDREEFEAIVDRWRETFAALDQAHVETEAEEAAGLAADAVRTIAALYDGHVQEAAEVARTEISHAIHAIVTGHEQQVKR